MELALLSGEREVAATAFRVGRFAYFVSHETSTASAVKVDGRTLPLPEPISLMAGDTIRAGL